MSRKTSLLTAFFASVAWAAVAAQPPLPPPTAPFPPDDFFGPYQPPALKDYSWIYIDPPEIREIKVHDIITILVDEKAEVTSNARFNRSRRATLKAELREFIRIGDSGNMRPAAEDSPTIDTTLNGRLNSVGQQTDQEGIRYRIAATVVDVLPNGNLVLEARKTIQTNRDIWSYSLTGTLPSWAVQKNNTAQSEHIADIKIVRKKSGKIYDSVRVPWGIRLIDIFFPF